MAQHVNVQSRSQCCAVPNTFSFGGVQYIITCNTHLTHPSLPLHRMACDDFRWLSSKETWRMQWQHRQCGMLTGSSSCCQTTQQATSSDLMLPCTALPLSLTSLAGAMHDSRHTCAYYTVLLISMTQVLVHSTVLSHNSFPLSQSGIASHKQHLF